MEVRPPIMKPKKEVFFVQETKRETLAFAEIEETEIPRLSPRRNLNSKMRIHKTATDG